MPDVLYLARLGLGYSIPPYLSVELNYRFGTPWGREFPWLVEACLAWWFVTGGNQRPSVPRRPGRTATLG